MKLLAIHVQHGAIDAEHGDVVQGALNYKEMRVGEVRDDAVGGRGSGMTPSPPLPGRPSMVRFPTRS